MDLPRDGDDHVASPGPGDDDAVWRALAHPLRRAVLDVLHERPRSTGELVDALDASSRHAVLQHLTVLRDADLVLVQRDGRRRINHLNAVPIQRIHRRWVSRYAEPWAAALVGLAHDVELAQRVGAGGGDHDDSPVADDGPEGTGRHVG